MHSEGFSQAGLNTNRIKKREPVRPHTDGRTRNTPAGWPVTDASDRADVDMDESADPDGLGREVTDTVEMAPVLAAPRTPTRTEREQHDVSHVPYRLWCRFCVMGRGLERRHLTDDDRPRVFADHGYLSGDSTPLLVASTGMTFAAAVSMKGDGLGVPGSHCHNRWRAQHQRAHPSCSRAPCGGNDHCGRDRSSK